MNDESIEQLINQWVAFKDAETSANKSRLAIEEKILEIAPGEKKIGALRVSYGTTESIDQARAMAVYKDWPEETPFPLKKQFGMDATAIKYTKEHYPALYKKIASCITSKPRKPSFTHKGD
jgi:hypothetical protein